MARSRPMPPDRLLDLDSPEFESGGFIPCEQTVLWIRATFIEEGATLFNEEHAHLNDAEIGVLWTNVRYDKTGKRVLGEARLGEPTGSNAWAVGRQEQQLRQFFGDVPDFVITVYAPYAYHCSDVEFCALVEHELLHCAQDVDAFGAPKFTKEGGPKFVIRGHDVEEFTTVVRRYGATDEATQAFLNAAKNGPEVGRADIANACGTCLRRVA